MLPRSLLAALVLYFPTLLAVGEVEFSSRLQLIPFDGDDTSFPSSYPLPAFSSHLKTRPITVYRPRSLDVLHNARLRSLQHRESAVEQPIWDPVQVEGPDVEDMHTLSQLARMSGNAYALPGRNNWYEVDKAWNKSFPFGWEEADGFRGHVFLSSDNSTVVLSIKGTTLQGSTSKLDKYNDNLLFSCCCARVDFSWVFSTVCDCYNRNFRCDNQCLTDALIQDSLFYSVGVKLVDDLRKIYPFANIWLVGHSLGGSLASLLGATYGLPAVAFEAPGEKLAASRLHLPLPPPIVVSRPDLASSQLLASQRRNLWSRLPYLRFPQPVQHTAPPRAGDIIGIPTPPSSMPVPSPSHHPVATTHVYHTADPIPQGACTGFRSPCAQAGYALETRCHLGQSIVFDTVERLNWKVDVRKHIIKTIVRDVLEGGVWWGDDDEEEGRDDTLLDGWHWNRRKEKWVVPKPIIESECVDCYKWEFGDFGNDRYN